jgi:acyl-CoA hydrolase
MYFGQLANQIREKRFTYDAIIIRVSTKSTMGYHSLGPNYDHVMEVIEANPEIKIIAEINPNVPFTTGNNYIKGSRLTAQFSSQDLLVSPAIPPVTDIDNQIATHLASLIPSGSSVQIGIGGVFGGLAQALQAASKNKITIWTEMFGDSAKAMIENNTATSAHASFAYGSSEMYQWLHKNSKVTFHSFRDISSPVAISRLDQFHAINTAFQVDLEGQVNATTDPGGFMVSSPGGQVEFMMHAQYSKGGKSIIALRSTAHVFEGNQRVNKSRIAPFLYYGPVTTPGLSVSHVVTEYGMAELSGKSRAERALALIRIAHPDFRQELLQGAVRNGQISQQKATEANIQ